MSSKLHKQRRELIKAAAILSSAVLLAVTAGCSFLPGEDRPLKPPLVKSVEAKIATADVQSGTMIKEVSGVSIFESVGMVYHQFTESGGRVAEVLIRSGDTVKEGDVLFRLETSGIDIELLQRQLEVEKKKLAMDEAKTTGDSRRIRIASMELQIAQMWLDSVEDKLSNKQLIAKMDGVVVFVADIKPGDLVEEYRVIATVADPGEMRLAFSTPTSNVLSEVSVGLTVNIEFEDKTYQGKVVQTPSTAPYEDDERLRDRYAETMYIKMLDIPEGAEIGDMASINIITAKKENVLLIPKRGLRNILGRSYVQLLEGESRREIDVEVGMVTVTEVEIIKGLEVGQSVILQ